MATLVKIQGNAVFNGGVKFQVTSEEPTPIGPFWSGWDSLPSYTSTPANGAGVTWVVDGNSLDVTPRSALISFIKGPTGPIGGSIDARGCTSLTTLSLTNETLNSLNISGCTSLISFEANMFPFTPIVDYVLTTINNFNTSGGFIDLRGSIRPTNTGLAAKASLESRGWTVWITSAGSGSGSGSGSGGVGLMNFSEPENIIDNG